MNVAERPRAAVHPLQTSAAVPVAEDVATGLRHFAEHGVVIHKGLISKAEAQAIQDRLEEQAYMERRLGVAVIGGPNGLTELKPNIPGETADPVYQRVDSLVNKGRMFIDLMMNSTAHAYCNGVFGDIPWLLWNQSGIITRRGAAAQFLHTDQYQLPPIMSTICALVNVFICVSDFDLEMGPTGFVCGSQNGPGPRYDGDEWTPRAPAVAKAGDAIVWDGRVWHGQQAHDSDRTRYSIPMAYSIWAFRQGENYPASLHDDIYPTLTQEELLMLGFRSEMVGTMNAFGPRNPDDRRTWIGGIDRYVPELHRGS